MEMTYHRGPVVRIFPTEAERSTLRDADGGASHLVRDPELPPPTKRKRTASDLESEFIHKASHEMVALLDFLATTKLGGQFSAPLKPGIVAPPPKTAPAPRFDPRAPRVPAKEIPKAYAEPAAKPVPQTIVSKAAPPAPAPATAAPAAPAAAVKSAPAPAPAPAPVPAPAPSAPAPKAAPAPAPAPSPAPAPKPAAPTGSEGVRFRQKGTARTGAPVPQKIVEKARAEEAAKPAAKPPAEKPAGEKPPAEKPTNGQFPPGGQPEAKYDPARMARLEEAVSGGPELAAYHKATGTAAPTGAGHTAASLALQVGVPMAMGLLLPQEVMFPAMVGWQIAGAGKAQGAMEKHVFGYTPEAQQAATRDYISGKSPEQYLQGKAVKVPQVVPAGK